MKNFYAGFFVLICAVLVWFYVNQLDYEPEIYALKYGESSFNEKYIFKNGDDRPVDFAWSFFAVKDKHSVFLIDTGIANPKMLRLWKIKNYVSPIELLEKIGVKKEDITGIILSHLHADHVDGLTFFKGIPVYLQQNEYDAITQAFDKTEKKYSRTYYRYHYNLIKDAHKNGNLILINGKKRISPNISVELAPYHTAGDQTVIVKKGKKYFYFVPDNAYMYKNITDLIPVGLCYDEAGNLGYLKELTSFDPSRKIVVPAHDPGLFKKFGSDGEPIVKLE